MADEEVVKEPIEVKPEIPVEIPAEPPSEPELPLAETPESVPEVVAEPVEAEALVETKPDWKDKELKKKHAQIMEARRQLEAKEKEIEGLRSIATKSDGTQPVNATLPQNEVEAAAKRLVAQERYIEECNRTAYAGENRYKGEWKEAISNLETLGGFDMDTMNGLLATDDPPKVLYEIGKNPDHYHRIMEMSAPKRILEMGKLAMQPTQAKKVSEAPAPVRPVSGSAAPPPTTLTDNMNDDAWYAARQAQRRAKWEANNRRSR